jgi:hypothetical protein
LDFRLPERPSRFRFQSKIENRICLEVVRQLAPKLSGEVSCFTQLRQQFLLNFAGHFSPLDQR